MPGRGYSRTLTLHINAVIRAKELGQPVLVGWFMAGALIAS